MGDNGASDRTIWYQSTPLSRKIQQVQNDVDVLTNGSNGFGFRADDYPVEIAEAASEATAVHTDFGPGFEVSGIIEQTSDRDFFRFTTSGGMLSLRVDTLAQGIGNLHAELELYRVDASGQMEMIEQSDERFGSWQSSFAWLRGEDWGASVQRNLEAGKYVVAVRSFGDHGDLGQYTLRGSVDPPSLPIAPGMLDRVPALPNRERPASHPTTPLERQPSQPRFLPSISWAVVDSVFHDLGDEDSGPGVNSMTSLVIR